MDNKTLIILGLGSIAGYLYMRENYQKHIRIIGGKISTSNGLAYVLKVKNDLLPINLRDINAAFVDGNDQEIGSVNLYTRNGILDKGENDLIVNLENANIPGYDNLIDALRGLSGARVKGYVNVNPIGIPFSIPFNVPLV